VSSPTRVNPTGAVQSTAWKQPDFGCLVAGIKNTVLSIRYDGITARSRGERTCAPQGYLRAASDLLVCTLLRETHRFFVLCFRSVRDAYLFVNFLGGVATNGLRYPPTLVDQVHTVLGAANLCNIHYGFLAH